MGIYLNPENVDFQKSLNSEIYIDKTELIAYTNKKLNTEQGYICVSRPRRFGKSMAANMLTAYYSRGCDSRRLSIFVYFAQFSIDLFCFCTKKEGLSSFLTLIMKLSRNYRVSKNVSSFLPFASFG